MSIIKKIKGLPFQWLVQRPVDQVQVLEKKLFESDKSVKSTDVSPVMFDIPGEMPKLESTKAELAGFPRTVPLVISSFQDIKKSLKIVVKGPATPKKELLPEELKQLEEFCRSLGVGAIGYVKVPRKYIFKNKAIHYENAVVLAMEMDKGLLERAPSNVTGVMVHKVYNKLGKVSLKVGEFLKNMGVGVHSGHPLLGQVLYPALAVKAGMGWYGKHGLLITPEFGPRVRLTAVYTSVTNLPFAIENPHNWIENFCRSCKLCVKKCPAKAIYEESKKGENGLIKAINTHKCFPFFAENDGCGVCLKVCPFNQIGYQKLHKLYINRSINAKN